MFLQGEKGIFYYISFDALPAKPPVSSLFSPYRTGSDKKTRAMRRGSCGHTTRLIARGLVLQVLLK